MSGAEAVDKSVKPGDLVAGKYRVERTLGEGGMGVVLAATHDGLDQRVAIKILRETQPDAVRRFDVEARASSRLPSPHAARTFDVGKLDDGRPYLVMEYLEGRDLGDVIEKDPLLPVPVLVDYVLQACEAIAEAHAAGIVHRDLKPSNLFLTTTPSGRPHVKVLDFGISKVEGMNESQRITSTQQIVGSPVYMSPEQLVASRDVDARTDIWSLGVVLYEGLTQKLPFEGTTFAGISMAIGRDRETPIDTLRELPNGLGAVVARCLAKTPAERFATVADLVEALEPYASPALSSSQRLRAAPPNRPSAPVARTSSPVLGTSQTIEMPPRKRASRTPIYIAVAAFALLAIAGAVLMVLSRRGTRVDDPPTAASSAPPEPPSAPPAVSTSAVAVAEPAVPSSPEPAVSSASRTAAPARPRPSVAPRASAASAPSVTASASARPPSLYGRE